MITQKELKDFLYYNSKTGMFVWLKSLSNRVAIGSVAGCKCNSRYTHIVINKNHYLAHRLAWLYVYGYFPENQIDHINRNGTDNRIINLREVTMQCNIRNTGNYKNNVSGIKGVSWIKKHNVWQSYITINNKTKYIGQFKNFDEAVAHRLAAEQCFNWAGCDSSSPAYKYIKSFCILEVVK